jgi:hypothetical protein
MRALRALFFVSRADSKYCVFSKLRMKLKSRSWSKIRGVNAGASRSRFIARGRRLMKPENSSTVTLTESELNPLVSGLVVIEREQPKLANLAREIS